jgi:tetratricopeptide (TPR) repeat protein
LARIDAAVAQMRAAEPLVAESQAPFVVAISVHTTIVAMYLQRDDMPASQAVYDEAQALLPQPPLNQLLEAIAATLAARDGRFEAARSHLANFEAVIEQMGLGYLAFQVPMLRAEILHQEGRDADAARNLEQALAMIDESFIAGQLYGVVVPELLADLASLQISAGRLDAAESTLERGFRIDPFLPHLWLARATLQKERGQDQLAQASLGQVLAFWSEADPEHVAYQEALALVEALAQSGP